MKSHSRHWAAVLAAFAVALTSCAEEDGRARNSVQVLSLNDNQPLLSDVYNFGRNAEIDARDDDFIPIDIVEVTFVSRLPEDTESALGPGSSMGSVRFHNYDVVFGDGGGADLDGNGTIDLRNFSAPMSAQVPAGGVGRASVLVVHGSSKVSPPIVCLGPFGGCTTSFSEFEVDARLTFHGTEETDGNGIEVSRGLTVRIAQFGDE